MNSNHIAVFPGTFDPFTKGHMDVVKRISSYYNQLIIAVNTQNTKTPLFNLSERMELIRKSVTIYSNIKVMSFDGLLIDFVKSIKSTVIIRGIRNEQDLNYEYQLFGMNQYMNKNIETFLVLSSAHVRDISAMWVREIVAQGGDVSLFVSTEVAQACKRKIGA